MGLIENLNVNPYYLFLGKGDMFITDASEIENLRKENREWIQRHNEALKTIMELNEIIKTLEKRNADLIDLSSAAIKYHKGLKQEQVSEENNMRDPLAENLYTLHTLQESEQKKSEEEQKKSLQKNKK